MKIVCASCGAKYAISDDKVRGKVFKIRCKKCSHVIVVKGDDDGQGPGDDATYEHVMSPGAGVAEWYVVINNEQVGPITPDEVAQYFQSGQIDAETFVWRDGLADWAPMYSVDELAHLTQPPQAQDEATRVAMSRSSAEMDFDAHGFGYGAVEPAYMPAEDFRDSYPSRAGQNAGELLGEVMGNGYGDEGLSAGVQRPAVLDGPFGASAGRFDAFGSSDQLSLGAPAAKAPSPAPAASLGVDLVNTRNDDSVLFSLGALSTAKNASRQPEPANASKGATVDGSGLIDLQALASAHSNMKGAGRPPGGAPEPFKPVTMSMPVLMPMAARRRSNTGLLVAVVVVSVLLLVVAGAALVWVLKSGQNPTVVSQEVAQAPVAAPTQPTDEELRAESEASEAAAAALVAAGVKKEVPADTAKPEPAPAPEKAPEPEKRPEEPKPATKPAEPPRQVASRTPEKPTGQQRASVDDFLGIAPSKPVATETAPAKKKGIDDIIGQIDRKPSGGSQASAQAAPPAPAPPAPVAAPSGELPPKLTKPMVQSTVRQHMGRVAGCASSSNANQRTGTVGIKFTVLPNGAVSNTQIETAEFQGTDVGRCVEGVVRAMKFPESQSDLTITYPFTLR